MTALREYNYETFNRSQSGGKSGDFKDLLRAGDAAPDFTLQTPDGDTISLSQFRGKKHVLLEFGSIT